MSYKLRIRQQLAEEKEYSAWAGKTTFLLKIRV